ncbi:isoamylase [Cellulomonas shaoxiangyii]|uniref:Isoamylase n=1 Tax=Cellulomonas shaoxiangyii TaxID=2566013 RepID=A0A4P7SM89_9CELL|nr:isoamylase [Cellulomonas shaoxiangyii]TGY86310.1 isoamylase [Cellulomonas shaoxiangyii]
MLKKSRSAKSGTCTLTFALPTPSLDGPVSVVGTFNDWTPARHVLRKRSNGMSSTSVTVPVGTVVTFRYLGDGGKWFDDIDADRVTNEGSVVAV